MKVLITGGAGYKGIKLAQALLAKGNEVTIFDNFMFGYESILCLAENKKCFFIQKDIRNITPLDLKGFDLVYHLAALSGYPACEANPHSAQMINVEGTRKLCKNLSTSQILVYASTTSIYGDSGTEVDEKSKIKAVSLYALTKYRAEQIVMKREKSISFRFATLFGISPRMRNDLMINDFVYRAISERSLVLFDAESVRTFLHISDAISAYVMASKDNKKMLGEVYNVGSNNLNFSKKDLALSIKKYVNFDIIESKFEDRDRRDFVINYDKLEKLGFKAKIGLDEGIKELVKLYLFYRPHSYFRPI